MYKLFWTSLILCLLISFKTKAQSPSKATDILDYAKHIKNHKNLYANIKEKEFDLYIQSLANKSELLDKETIWVELLKLNAIIQDEHTNLFPLESEKSFPFHFSTFEEGVFIVSVQDDSLHLPYLLHQVVAINDVPIENILDKLKYLVKQDNPSYARFFYDYYLNQPSILKGLGVTKGDNNIIFSLLPPFEKNEKKVIVSLNDIASWQDAPQSSQLLANKQEKNYWFYYDETNKVMYFQYKKCRQIPDEPFVSFQEMFFKELEKTKPDKIVIDLRKNTGGNSSILNPFIEAIKASKWNEKNKLFVLIGKSTMSSAVMGAIDLKKKTNAIFIGEETGGNVNHYGEIKSFELPFLGLRGIYSTKYWEKWGGYEGGLKPDIKVKYDFAHFFTSIDPALQIVY